MPNWRVPLSDVVIPEEDIEAVAATYRSGWLSMGPQTGALESELSAFTGAAHVVAVANGTVGLHLMCAGVGLGPGDEVIVPSLTFVATANAVAYTGATVVFADIAGLDAPWLSANAVESLITPQTRAIMNMTYGGFAGESTELRDLALDRGIMLLEDAAHGIGTRLDGTHVGRFGRAGGFSFFSNKNLAIGEGGAVITDEDELAERMRLLRSHGMTTLSWDRYQGHAASYDVVALGFNYRLDDPRATLARQRLRRLNQENDQRAALVARYRERLGDSSRLQLVRDDRAEEQPSHHLFTIVVDASVDRDGLRAALAADGIQTSMHYPPAHGFRFYAQAPRGPVDLTEAYSARALSLPLYPHMTTTEQDLVIESLERALG